MIFLLSALEEISFFKELETGIFYPYFLAMINAPITLFEIFPFIFLITTQFFFYELIKTEELKFLKINGISNLKIITSIFALTLFIGIFNIVVYYNLASKLKFSYSEIKNSFSKDNKYLAMVIDTGLWIKDEIKEEKFILKSKKIENNYLLNNTINIFNKEFELQKTINSEKIDISSTDWVVYKPLITINNVTKNDIDTMIFASNFNEKKIRNLFSNISTLNIIKLFDLRDDYKKLGYSTNEIIIHLSKLFTMPIFYSVLTVLASVIVLNMSKYNSVILHIILGILISVIIYYFIFVINSMGNTGKIPWYISIAFPLVTSILISFFGLIKINEK